MSFPVSGKRFPEGGSEYTFYLIKANQLSSEPTCICTNQAIYEDKLEMWNVFVLINVYIDFTCIIKVVLIFVCELVGFVSMVTGVTTS